ncbi:MAG: hypothetical protein EAZ89_20240, partial [Bacteroidetes bacterium]
MRQLFTLFLLAAVTSAGYGQSKKMVQGQGMPLQKIQQTLPTDEPQVSGNSLPSPLPVGTVLTDAVSSVKIGESANSLTYVVPSNQQLSAVPGVGTNGGSVAMIFRNNGAACGGSSGLYRYTISTNGGLSWSVG